MGSAARAQAPEQVILGVDPGLTRCGFGIVRMRAAVSYTHLTLPTKA